MLKISQKVYLLVFLPLLFQCLFVGTLFVLSQQAEIDTEREIFARTVLARVRSVGFSVWKSTTYLESYARSRDTSLRQKFSKSVSDIHDSLAALKKLIEADPDRMRRFKAIERELNASEVMLDTALKSADGGVDDWQNVSGTFYGRLRERVVALATALDSVIEDERMRSEELTKARVESRKNLQMTLIAGAGGTAVVTFVLAIFLNKGTLRRLQSLMRNIEDMRVGKQLQPPMEGEDELAILDHRFHTMETEIRRHEKERADMEQLRQRFFAMISHDMKVPLSSLKVFLDLINDGSYSKEEIADRAGIQRANIGRLIELVSDLIELEKLNSPSFALSTQEVGLASLCDEALESVTHLAEAQGISLKLNLNATKAIGEERRLLQVLVNLLSNAIKFSSRGGEVVLSAIEQNDSILLQVRDNGCGIPRKQLEAIFEPFSQVNKNRTESTGSVGLGLAICRAIVLAHGGKLTVESEEGKGSTFSFSISKS